MISAAFAAPWKQGPHPDLDELAALGERSKRAYERFVLRTTERAPTHVIVCGDCATTRTRLAVRSIPTAAEPGRGTGARQLATLPRAIKRVLLGRIVWPDEERSPPLRRGFDESART